MTFSTAPILVSRPSDEKTANKAGGKKRIDQLQEREKKEKDENDMQQQWRGTFADSLISNMQMDCTCSIY